VSDLQLGLLSIGAVVVAAVLGYNKWQELKFRRESERSLKSDHEDVLMNPPGDAAPAHDVRVRATVHEHAPEERIEPTFEAPAAPSSRPAPDTQTLSEAIDFIVTIETAEGRTGEAIVEASAAALAGFAKRVQWEGFNAGTGQFEPMRRSAQYALLRAGLQLADRNGGVSAEDLTRFCAALEQVAAAAGATASLPDRSEALARSAELDGFCGKVDIQIAIHMVAVSGLFTGTKIRALAEAAGLVLEDDGQFRRRDELGRVLYGFCNRDRTPFRTDTMRTTSVAGLTLELDVPRTPDAARAFEQFREFAQRFALAIEGSIIDDNRKEVSGEAFNQILAQIQVVQRAMLARSVAPGSRLALRLFS